MAISYKVYFAYNPPTSAVASHRINKDMAQGSFGELSGGAKFVVDVGVGTPLVVFGNTEEVSYLLFTPMAGRVYCIEGEVIAGDFIGHPNLKFVDRMRCEVLFGKK